MRLASRALALACLTLLSPAVPAADVSVIGLFPGKAVLVIDGGAPKTYSVGDTVADGIRLVGVGDGSATFDSKGRRETLALGSHVNRSAGSGLARVTMQANGQGHFIAQGQINGGSVPMLVDTGATMVALPAGEAARLGIAYRHGRPAQVRTANGTVPAYLVRLDSVKVGDIELRQVDAVVQESGLPFALLGMSFLNRTEMRREGEQMTLTKRY